LLELIELGGEDLEDRPVLVRNVRAVPRRWIQMSKIDQIHITNNTHGTSVEAGLSVGDSMSAAARWAGPAEVVPVHLAGRLWAVPVARVMRLLEDHIVPAEHQAEGRTAQVDLVLAVAPRKDLTVVAAQSRPEHQAAAHTDPAHPLAAEVVRT
jgi:hypothetical protein